MRKIINCFLFTLFFNSAYGQQNHNSMPVNNIGMTVNILGPLFGEYGLGVSTFVNPYIQVGANTTYYSTQYITPEVDGWQSDLRVNYFFSGWHRSGFYLGATGGYECVHVKKNSDSNLEYYNDTTWSIIPGYAWSAGKSFTLLLGLKYGYNFGDIDFSPEIGFVIML